MSLQDEKDLTINPTTRSVVDLIGFKNLALLSIEHAYKILNIAKDAERSSLQKIIGIDAAKKFSAVYGGMQYPVPFYPGLVYQVLDLWAQGWGEYRISYTVRVSRSKTARIIENYINLQGCFLKDEFFCLKDLGLSKKEGEKRRLDQKAGEAQP